jgi:hypothetical protein
VAAGIIETGNRMSDPIQILLSLPIWLVILLFSHPVILIGVLFLLFYWGRGSGRAQRRARTALLLIAIASTAITAFFVYLGFDIRWSTDGPGLLVVFMGIGGFGVLAIVTWTLWVIRIRKP